MKNCLVCKSSIVCCYRRYLEEAIFNMFEEPNIAITHEYELLRECLAPLAEHCSRFEAEDVPE